MQHTLTGTIIEQPIRKREQGQDTLWCRLRNERIHRLQISGACLAQGEQLQTGSRVRVSGRLKKRLGAAPGAEEGPWFVAVETLEILDRAAEPQPPSAKNKAGTERGKPAYKGFLSHRK